MPLLDYEKTHALLQRYGLRECKTVCCQTGAEVVGAATKMSPPFVLKAICEHHVHKTEEGLVKTNIHDLNELGETFKAMKKKTRHLGVSCFLLQEQKNGIEFIVGGKKDDVFGSTVLFGSGGILTELFKDTSTRVAPLSRKDAEALIAETKAGVFFKEKGFRGRKANKAKIIDLLLRASKMLLERAEIKELDFNPVIADEKDYWIVDARVIV